ncbi:MAG: dipeptidase [Actinomycetes bacterium]|jgi:acetylornithine deacetylase/succinyl-diaminopimelate desuccinylase-like protein|nr:dipeptidase [Acidimicrobiia bacterium]
MPDDLHRLVEEDFPRLRAILEDLVRIPSVSAPGHDPENVRRSADHVAGLLRAEGLSDVQLLELEGAHPAVFGQIPGPEGAPTVLLYAHHDVQPPGPAEEWETGPFDPFESGGRLYGRGASDDKSGIVMHLGAIRALKSDAGVGIKVFVEGEEEVGSPHLPDFLEEYSDLLAADVIVIADSSNWDTGVPTLTTSLRGLVSVIVEVRTLHSAQHSGMFGGLYPDAITALSRLLATLHTDDGSVAVEGLISEEVEGLELSEEQARAQATALPGVQTIGTGSLVSRMWTKPAIAVLAVDAPPLSEAINQLVPVARAKVSMRIPPAQDPDAAMEALTNHLKAHAPWGAQVTVTPAEAGRGFALSTEGPAFEAWREGMRRAWGREPVEMGVGGSIPFVAAFSEKMPQAPIVLVGAGDPKSSVHAPNESQDLDDLKKSVLAEAIALRILAGRG